MKRCTNCFYPFDQLHLLDKTATTVHPGMITICSRCAQVYKADENSDWQLMDKEEIDQMVHDSPDSYVLVVKTVAFILGRVQMN